jgi:uncharacterized membrane protein
MNAAHLHLLTNHFPIIGTIFSTLILAYGILYKNQTVKNTGLVLFILTALLAIPAFKSGEGAEDVLESIGQKNQFYIDQHKELAKNSMWLCESIALLSLGALLNRNNKKKYIHALIIIILFAGLFNSALMVIAGNYGGQIRHSEIRNNIIKD